MAGNQHLPGSPALAGAELYFQQQHQTVNEKDRPKSYPWTVDHYQQQHRNISHTSIGSGSIHKQEFDKPIAVPALSSSSPSTETLLTLSVPKEAVAILIGKGGSTVSEMELTSGTRIKILKENMQHLSSE